MFATLCSLVKGMDCHAIEALCGIGKSAIQADYGRILDLLDEELAGFLQWSDSDKEACRYSARCHPDAIGIIDGCDIAWAIGAHSWISNVCSLCSTLMFANQFRICTHSDVQEQCKEAARTARAVCH